VDKDTSEYISASQFEFFEQYGNGAEFYSLANPLQLTDKRSTTADAKFDLVWQTDEINELKFGLQYRNHWLNLFSIYDPKRDNPYIDDYETNPFEAAAYLQDKIELPYLIINLGLRFDYSNANVEFRQEPLQPDTKIKVEPRMQISPRLGISHPVSEFTKIHFAYGHFFQNPEYQYMYENKQYDIGVREPIFGQPNLDAQRTISYEVGLAHQFSRNIALHLTAFYKDVTGYVGTHYYEFRDDYTNQYTAYTLYVNEDYANIKGFEANLDIRPTRYFSGGLTYTYQIAKGSASSETEQYPGTQESTKLYYLDFDKTHVFNATATIRIPQDEGPVLFNSKILGNTDYSFILRASSGYPYTPTGRDIGFVDRNSLRQPATYSLDLELGKSFNITNQFSMRIFAQIRNLTNHRNIVWVYSDTGDPDYTTVGGYSTEYMHDPSNYGPPQLILLGVGIRM
jgi:outer membrane receptor for Fe3+-dicitrate